MKPRSALIFTLKRSPLGWKTDWYSVIGEGFNVEGASSCPRLYGCMARETVKKEASVEGLEATHRIRVPLEVTSWPAGEKQGRGVEDVGVEEEEVLTLTLPPQVHSTLGRAQEDRFKGPGCAPVKEGHV